LRHLSLSLLAAAGTLVLVGAGLTGAHPAAAAASLPCDIYAAGGTPCVAAHSTTRALFTAYDGPLYQVRRASDNTTADIAATIPAGMPVSSQVRAGRVSEPAVGVSARLSTRWGR
jgi:non-reducing end alpha-L-arabinofuranosidase